MAATPSAVILTAGSTVASQIAVSAQNGFTGAVAFSATGLPAGVTATFAPASSASTSTVTFGAAANAALGKGTVIITGTAGALTRTTTISLTVSGAPNFALAATPSAVTVLAGSPATSRIAVAAQNGFAGAAAFSVTGLPAGVTASFSPASSTSASTITFAAAANATPGTVIVTISGASGASSRSTAVSLTVAAIVVTPPGAVPVPVNMGAAFNVYGIVNDPGEAEDGGLDGNGYAYSAKLLGPSISALGVSFKLGAPSTQNAASRTYIALPAGNFVSLKLLGAAVNGNQMNQPFLVTYTDGTISTFVQSVSDWARPQNYPGESQAATTSYRLDDDGRRDVAPFLVYGYSFLLNNSKTVRSLTRPNNRSVTVLAIALVPTSAGTVNRDFDLTATPAALNLQPGRTATSHIAISAINGFTGAVTFNASGLPSGVSATFSPASSTGSSTVTFTATSSAARGTATVTIAGTSGALRHTDTIALTVAGPVMVNMTSAFNVTGILSEGNVRVTGGLDGYGHYYSSKLLGDSITALGVPFDLGDPGSANAATKTTISLPAGSFASLKFLGAAVNGSQSNQVFLVTYTDGTTNTFHQSMSEWTRSKDYEGEEIASSMPYRLAWWGIQYQTSRLYGYSFDLNSTKKVKSLTLPSNRNVTVLAITLQ